MLSFETHPTHSCSPEQILKSLPATTRRILFFGRPGSGKSSLAIAIAHEIGKSGKCCFLLSADPGSPLFGVPGALNLGYFQEDQFKLVAIEGLCSLDAGRFRLPLISATGKLAALSQDRLLLIDAPGVVRGVAGAELLTGLVETALIDTILAFQHENSRLPLPNELASSGTRIYIIHPSPLARQQGKRSRRRQRTALWDTYLESGRIQKLPLAAINVLGTPPPLDAVQEWPGRQVALLHKGQTQTMGEVVKIDNQYFHCLTPDPLQKVEHILIRDACRDKNGWLATAKPFASGTLHYIPPPDIKPFPGYRLPSGPCPVASVGKATAILVNGIFGDPLLHIRLSNRKRSFLFDLGEGLRLPARIAHQVSDVFITHAHFDHISGFLWLLRSRIGAFPPCRMYGPPGLAEHISGMIRGILWDRVGQEAPRFEIFELHGDILQVFVLQAGKEGISSISKKKVTNGVLLKETGFLVRATILEHGTTPVLAYSFEQYPEFNIRKESLAASGLPPGPWIQRLKHCIASSIEKTEIQLPDGSKMPAADLAEMLLKITQGQKLVYATDLADTPLNREKLKNLAHGAHAFFCEAAFTDTDKDRAQRSGHLTAAGCGEIAEAAKVQLLVPFHLSRRYEKRPRQIYREIRAACSRLMEPNVALRVNTPSDKSGPLLR